MLESDREEQTILSLVWVDLIQYTEDLMRTKKWKKREFAFFCLTALHGLGR